MSQPTVLAVDGNSLLHRAFHASARSGFRIDGRPAWAVRGLLSQLVAAVDRVCADAVVVGFDDRGNSSRKKRWPTYKAHRVPKPETLESQLDLAVVVLRAPRRRSSWSRPGWRRTTSLASVAAQAPALGARTVVATSDRDSFSLIDEHTRMLRILNGGVDASPLLDPARLAMVTGVRPEQYSDLAALRGDASDNLPGVSGFGAKTAVKLLTELDTAEAAFADALAGGERCRAAVGSAPGQDAGDPRGPGALRPQPRGHGDGRDRRARPRPGAGGSGVLPLDEETVRSVFTRFELHVPAAIRALTPQGAHPVGRADLRRPALVGPRRPAVRPLPQLVPSAPAYVQETCSERLALGVTDGQGRRIVAVVVTYNRLPLLAAPGRPAGRGPGARRGAGGRQRVDRRHGRRGCEDAPVSSRTLPTNTGGAGGFHDGLAWAVERGADLVWLMDDDGLPDPDCLGRLLEHPDLDFWGPVVVDEDDPGPAGLPDPAAGRHPRRARDGRGPGGRHGRRDPRRGHPLQRRARHPRPGRADRAAARGVLHLGRRRRVPLARQRAPAPGPRRWWTRDRAPPERGRPRHAG